MKDAAQTEQAGKKRAGKRSRPKKTASEGGYSSHSALGKAISKQAPPSSQDVARMFPP